MRGVLGRGAEPRTGENRVQWESDIPVCLRYRVCGAHGDIVSILQQREGVRDQATRRLEWLVYPTVWAGCAA